MNTGEGWPMGTRIPVVITLNNTLLHISKYPEKKVLSPKSRYMLDVLDVSYHHLIHAHFICHAKISHLTHKYICSGLEKRSAFVRSPAPAVCHLHLEGLCLASSLTQSFTLIPNPCWSQFPQSCTLQFCFTKIIIPQSLSLIS